MGQKSVAAGERLNAKSVTKFLSNYAIVILIVLMAIFVGLTRPGFLSGNNIKNLAMNASVRFIIAAGVSGCLITKGTDLSAGRIVGLSACISATLLQNVTYSARFFPDLPDFPVIGGLVISVLVCAAIGAVNGLVIAYLKVPPFIATLGMQTIVYGICQVYTGNDPQGGLKPTYTRVANGALDLIPGVENIPPLKTFLFYIPFLAIIAIVVGLFMWFLYNKTRHGKYMYAIGGNENAASVAGVNVPFTIIRIYTLAAILYGLAGFLAGAKAGGASTGFGYELEAIAACTIGGVSTNGGVGKVSGILVGVLVFETLKICLQFLNVNPAYTYIVQGVVIVVAVALDLRKYLAKK